MMWNKDRQESGVNTCQLEEALFSMLFDEIIVKLKEVENTALGRIITDT